MSRFKVGLIGPGAPPAGGMAAQTEQLRNLLLEEGLEVLFLQTNRPYSPAWLKDIRGVRAAGRLCDYLFRLWGFLGKVDVVHVMSNSGWSWQLFTAPVIWLSRCRGRPVIVNYRGGSASKYLAKSLRWVKPSLDQVDALVVPSSYLKEVFQQFGYEARVIPNIIDTTKFKPQLASKNAHRPMRLIITRNLEAIYGIDTALKAMAALKSRSIDFHLSIAGTGPEELSLRNLAKDLGLTNNVSFLGRLTREQVGELYSDADLFINTSRIDNMPNSLLESMASGVPIVTTNAGGIPWIVEHEKTALLCPVDDIEIIAKNIERLILDDSLRATLTENGLKNVEAYSWPQVKSQWLSLYQGYSQAGSFKLGGLPR